MKTIFLSTLAVLALATTTQAQWNSYHGSPQRHGRSAVNGPTNPSLQWSLDLGYPITGSPVVGPSGTIYIGGQPDLSQNKPRTLLSAINPNGTFKWRYEVPYTDYSTVTSPTVDANGDVYFGDGAGRITALTGDGKLKWQIQNQKPIITQLLHVGTDTLYFQADGYLHNVDSGSGVVRWSVDLGLNYPGGPSADLAGNTYVVSGNGLRSYSPTGSLRWHAPLAGSVSPIAIGPDGNLWLIGNGMMKVNSATGDFIWMDGASYQFNSDVTPSVDAAGNSYFCKTWSIIKVNPNGVQLWEHEINQSNYLGYSHSASIIDSAGRLYTTLGWYKRAALDVEKRLVCLDMNTGAMLWFRTLPDVGSPSSPAIGSDGTLYVGCTDGKLYAFR